MRQLSSAVLVFFAAACGGRTLPSTPVDGGPDTDAPAPLCMGKPDWQTTEICNGLDDDCDGVVDGPAADAWCALMPFDLDIANAEPACIAGQCGVGRCFPGFADCDGKPWNGCETQLGTETDCAACGDVCARPFATTQCSGGRCEVTSCAPGRGDCNGDDRDGCEAVLALRFQDADGDGFGAGGPQLHCPKEPGTSEMGGDCYDGNPAAKPGQSAFFAVQRGDASFDYDCDGAETLELPNLASNFCVCSMGTCSIGEGWQGSVPPCGATGLYRQKNPMQPFNCSAIVTQRTQRCR
jgi:hypothetical protein